MKMMIFIATVTLRMVAFLPKKTLKCIPSLLTTNGRLGHHGRHVVVTHPPLYAEPTRFVLSGLAANVTISPATPSTMGVSFSLPVAPPSGESMTLKPNSLSEPASLRSRAASTNESGAERYVLASVSSSS